MGAASQDRKGVNRGSTSTGTSTMHRRCARFWNLGYYMPGELVCLGLVTLLLVAALAISRTRACIDTSCVALTHPCYRVAYPLWTRCPSFNTLHVWNVFHNIMRMHTYVIFSATYHVKLLYEVVVHVGCIHSYLP